MEKVVLLQEPLIYKCNNFLDAETCKRIIQEFAEDAPKGYVIYEDGLKSLDTEYRSASVDGNIPKKIPDIDAEIRKRVSEFTGWPESHFEETTYIRYKEGERFGFHQDYHVDYKDKTAQSVHEERCSYGGNRVATVILYLNEVEAGAGGHTYFPWIDYRIRPEQGKLLYFQYNYDDENYMSNLHTQHEGLPVEKGSKYIVTIWIRESDIGKKVLNFKHYTNESFFYENFKDTEFTLEVGPDYDRRELKVTLPANNHPKNCIGVGFTGGYDSTLLLFLLCVLNSHQKIPYIIRPFVLFDETRPEDVDRARLLIEFMKQYSSSNYTLKNLKVFDSEKTVNGSFGSTYVKVIDQKFLEENYIVSSGKTIAIKNLYNLRYMFLGDNELPNENHEWTNLHWKRIKSEHKQILQPLFNLQKYHIVDAIFKLGIEEIFNIISPCSEGHSSLEETCWNFPCNERRWAFTKLKYDGAKYVIFPKDLT
jgi:prolyl 4-hydroxylase